MNTEKLVRMANQIADYFAIYPEKAAVAGVREHVIAFWTPKMLGTLRTAAMSGPCGLHPIALSALLTEPDADSPAEKAAAGPGALGALASDAG